MLSLAPQSTAFTEEGNGSISWRVRWGQDRPYVRGVWSIRISNCAPCHYGGYPGGLFGGSLFASSGHRSSISSRIGTEMASMRLKSRTSLWMPFDLSRVDDP